MRFRFTIRDLLWLTALVALGVGWWVDHNRMKESPSWIALGLQIEPATPQQFLQSKYRGGMSVIDVRPGSAAAQNGVQPGDVLVGINIWETISDKNIDYILNRKDLAELQPYKFHILRGNHMRFRFTIRDLLWLTAVAALSVGWWVERHSHNSWRSVRSEDGSVTIINRTTEEQVFLRGDNGAIATQNFHFRIKP